MYTVEAAQSRLRLCRRPTCGLDKSFVKSVWNKLVLACNLYKRIIIKFFLDHCQYSRVCNSGKRVVIKLLRTVLSVMFAYFQLKYG